MPVKVWGESPTTEVFISIERIPLVLADLRKALPELEKELCEKWPVESVNIEIRNPRLKNPTDTAHLIVVGGTVGLAIRFLGPSVDVAGKELAARVHRWLKSGHGVKKKKRKS